MPEQTTDKIGQRYDRDDGHDWGDCYPIVRDGVVVGIYDGDVTPLHDITGEPSDVVIVNDEYAVWANKYSIWTDAESMDDIVAVDVADALEQFGAPSGVRTPDQFRAWLESTGGFGHIDEDGVRLVKVSS